MSFHTRIADTVNSRLTLFARYVQSPSATIASGSRASINSTEISQQSNSGTIGLVHIISPAVNNAVRTDLPSNQSVTATDASTITRNDAQIVSFDISPDGGITLVEPPLAPITDAYRSPRPSAD